MELKVHADLFLKHISDLLAIHKKNFLDKNSKEQDIANKADAEERAKLEENQQQYQRNLLAHQKKVADERKIKEAKKAEELNKRLKELNDAKAKEALAEKEKQDKAEKNTKKLMDDQLNDKQKILLNQILSDHPPHNTISYESIENLIGALGGKIVKAGGSHQKIQVIIVNLQEQLCTIQDLQDEEFIAANKATQTCPIVKPHKAGHNAKLLPQYAIKQLRGFLENLGLKSASKPVNKEKKP